MQTLIMNALVYATAYVMFMVPSYILPWLGSNSTVLNTASIAVGQGLSPLWWVHFWCLGMLVLLAWVRGNLVGKKHLPVLTVLAAVFDLVPGLNLIPFAPSVFHLVAIISGVRGVAEQPLSETAISEHRWKMSHKVAAMAVLLTLAAVAGSVQPLFSNKNAVHRVASRNEVKEVVAQEGSAEPAAASNIHPAQLSTTRSAKPAVRHTQKSNDSKKITSGEHGVLSSKVQLINLSE